MQRKEPIASYLQRLKSCMRRSYSSGSHTNMVAMDTAPKGLLGLLVLASMSVLAVPMHAGPEDADDPETAAREELGEFGNGLKAAVRTGAMSKEDARSMWEAAVAAHRLEFPDQEEGKAEKKDESDEETARSRVGRLSPPWPHQLRLVFEPEFFTRDALVLTSRLQLEEEQEAIVDMVMDDYTTAWPTVTKPLRDALERWGSSEQARKLQEAVELLGRGIAVDEVDVNGIAKEWAQRGARKASSGKGANGGKSGGSRGDRQQQRAKIREKAREIEARLTKALASMDDRMLTLRERMQQRIAEIDPAGETVTSVDILRILQETLTQRANLHANVVEMLQAVIVPDGDPEVRRQLDIALAQLRLEQGVRHARMGGEAILPHRLLADVFQEGSPEAAVTLVRDSQLNCASLVTNRLEAGLQRELAGWQFMVVRDGLIDKAGREDDVELDQWVVALQPYSRAWRLQVQAAQACRDRSLEVVEATQAVLPEDAALDWHEAAMRAGFGLEMRRRWVERAMDAAFNVSDLTDEQREPLASLHGDVELELRLIRDAAIERRIARDPELAMSPVESFWADKKDVERPWTKEDWVGFEAQSHSELAVRTEVELESILTAEQFLSLPVRPGSRRAKEARAAARDDKGSAKGEGNKAKKNSGS